MRDGRLSKVVDGKSPLLASHRAAGGRTSPPWRRRRITHRSPPRRSISEPQNQLHAGQGSSLQGNLQGNRSTGEAALGWEGLTWPPGAARKGPRDALRMELGRAGRPCASQRGEARAPGWNKVSTVPRLIHVGKEAGRAWGPPLLRAQCEGSVHTHVRTPVSLHSDAVAKARNPVGRRK